MRPRSPRTVRSRRRSLLPIAIAALGLAAVTAPASALNYIFVCLCCRPDGSVRYIHGWCNVTCDWLNANVSAVVGCDTIFTALIAPPSGVGDGFAPAFDRALPLSNVIPSTDGSPDVRIVMGYYPAADPFVVVGGAYSTRVFAIRTIPGARAVNQFANIDIAVGGLDPLGVCVMASSVSPGEPVINPIDGSPMGLVGTGDATIVVQTHDGHASPTLVETRLIPIDFASLTWQDALSLPPMCLGDCDRSGAVSFADVTSALANFNNSYPLGVMMPGDANGDRTVNFSDITTILAAFGSSCGTP